jgi:hypothetical protein
MTATGQSADAAGEHGSPVKKKKKPKASTPAANGASVVDRYQAQWIAAHAGVPGIEAHVDRDIVWMIQPGAVWSNAGAALRLNAEAATARLRKIVKRYRENSRGAGFWVGPEATPADLEDRLRELGFRCRKRFPGMICDLSTLRRRGQQPRGLRVELVSDHAIFSRSPSGHPYFGPITTSIREFELGRLAHLNQQLPKRVFDLVALIAEIPVGACTVHLSHDAAGLHDVGVLESHRNRGIGGALVIEACRLAYEHGRSAAILISSGMGESVYKRVGFREVCQMAFWYQAFSRSSPGQKAATKA